MAAKTQALQFKQAVNAPPAEVYRAFTNSTALREWLCHAAQVEPRKGGRIHLWWNSGYYTTGEFTSLVPNKKIAFTWLGRDEPDATSVQVSIAEKRGAAVVTLAHAGIGRGKAWAKAIEEIGDGWQNSLVNLQSVLETGWDLRFTRRPMLGINVGVFDAGVAEKLGVPVKEGILLDGASEEMGAHAAGLTKGDVLVNIGGKKVTNWATLTGALARHTAGDEVKVQFYRGGEKNAVTVRLSPRPVDEPPAAAAALAEAARRMYADMDAQLAAALEGVSEEEASHKPGADEWSAKDVLCHLIVGERDTHAWISDLLGGQERWSDDWPGNLTLRHAGILAAFPTVPALLEELKCHEAETVGMLAALPPEFVARKGSYVRMAYSLLQAPEHVAGHRDQIRDAIASARK
jgi:uncharacterized protein YndB with AHSA1/START domain